MRRIKVFKDETYGPIYSESGPRHDSCVIKVDDKWWQKYQRLLFEKENMEEAMYAQLSPRQLRKL